VKVSLTGRVSIEADGVVVDEQRIPGRQGRLVFAYLAAANGRPVPRDELADALWDDDPPASWEKALSVLISKVRGVLGEAGVDGSAALTSAYGGYQLTLPAGSWIDVAAAEESIAAAEHALAAGEQPHAVAEASAAASLARGTFLPGEDARWVSERRAQLHAVLVRALETLAEATRLAGDAPAAVRAAEELVAVEPFRERGYRLLMEAQVSAGNGAEALRTYERCRTLLAEELGAYPSAETEAVYRELLQAPTKPGSHEPSAPPAPAARKRHRGLLAAAGTALLAATVAAAALAFSHDGKPSPRILPTSLVRIDPKTLKPTEVVRIGPLADLVVASGGYLWVTHDLLRYSGSDLIRNSGDRTLTRVDPSTGVATTVGGGVAPCGLTPDPSGDVWVANCYASGPVATVVRVDANSLRFVQTVRVPAGDASNYFEGLAYGGGAVWVAGPDGKDGVTKLNPGTRASRFVTLKRPAGYMTWADAYDDLWITNFSEGSVSQLNAATGDVRRYDLAGEFSPGSLADEGASMWVGDWNSPQVVRLPAVGSTRQRAFYLPATGGVTDLAAGDGAIWAAVPDSRAVWRIDTSTGRIARIPLRYFPWGVAVTDDGIWVSLRAHDPHSF
jgi:DNA-binding SARP family transcriptional activator/streptogramin lyase